MQGKGWSKNMQDRISNFCISSKKIIAFIQFNPDAKKFFFLKLI